MDAARIKREFTNAVSGLRTVVWEQQVDGVPLFDSVLISHTTKRGDLVKVLWWDGDGLCLFAKRLERGRFVWPQADQGVVSLSRAQLSMLLEGIDWRKPIRTAAPSLAV